MSRPRSSRDSDSRVKSGCSHLIRDGLTLYLGFFFGGGGGVRAGLGQHDRTVTSEV